MQHKTQEAAEKATTKPLSMAEAHHTQTLTPRKDQRLPYTRFHFPSDLSPPTSVNKNAFQLRHTHKKLFHDLLRNRTQRTRDDPENSSIPLPHILTLPFTT